MWIKTKGPLKDGWYWWKCRGDDPEPECLQICNGAIIDKRTSGDFGENREVYEHQDYSGFWYGPIFPPKFEVCLKSTLAPNKCAKIQSFGITTDGGTGIVCGKD